MTTQSATRGAATRRTEDGSALRLAAFAIAPLAALVAVLYLIALVGIPGGDPLPVEDVAIERVRVTQDGFALHVRNVGPQAVVIAQVIVNDQLVNFEAPDSLARYRSAIVTVPFHWVEAEPYEIVLLTENAFKFSGEVEAAVLTPDASARTLGVLTLLGLYVGAIPVLVGLLWKPLLGRIGGRGLEAVLGLTVGLLLFLAVDGAAEAFELTESLPGAFDPLALLVLSVVGAFAVLEWASTRSKTTTAAGRPTALALATAVALGVGLHNLGEGLAVGGAFALGEAALGVFLVVGFAVHNLTEGLAIVAPFGRERVKVRTLLALGLLAGLPTVAGAWMGGLLTMPLLSLIFLGVGVGAILQVARLIDRGLGGALRRGVGLAGVAVGVLIMYATSLLVVV